MQTGRDEERRVGVGAPCMAAWSAHASTWVAGHGCRYWHHDCSVYAGLRVSLWKGVEGRKISKCGRKVAGRERVSPGSMMPPPPPPLFEGVVLWATCWLAGWLRACWSC